MRPLTTPTHYFDLPIATEQVLGVEVIYKSGETTLLHKRTEDVKFEDNTVVLELTQADTKVFAGHRIIEIQLRVMTKDCKVPMTDVFRVTVDKCLFEEEMTA